MACVGLHPSVSFGPSAVRVAHSCLSYSACSSVQAPHLFSSLCSPAIIGPTSLHHSLRDMSLSYFQSRQTDMHRVHQPVSMSLQLHDETNKEFCAPELNPPTVVSISIHPEAISGCFEADFRSEYATWPDDLGTTTDYHKIEEFVVSAHALVRRWLLPDVVSRLERFVYDLSQPPVLVIRGLPIDRDLPPTGPDGLKRKAMAGKFMSDTWLVGIARIVGQPFTLKPLRTGDPGMALLISDVYTTPDKVDEVTVNGCHKFLDFHVDFFQAKPQCFPTVLGFIGLRGDPSRVARTLFCDFRKVYAELDPSDIQILREQKITWGVQEFSFSKCVIEGTDSNPIFNLFEDNFLSVGSEMIQGNPEAVAAYKRAKDAARAVGQTEGVWLDGGDVMLVNQRRVARGHSGHTPKFEGQDQWMHRVYINEGSIWEPTGFAPWPVRCLPMVVEN